MSKTPSPSKSKKSLNTADPFLKSLELDVMSDKFLVQPQWFNAASCAVFLKTEIYT